jgi:predicted permease
VNPAEPHDRRRTDPELLLYGSAFAVFAIACINLAALVLARGATRKRNYALRRAIGASGKQIAREVLAEVAIVSVLGAVAGGILASIGISMLRGLIPDPLIASGIRPPEWDTHVFALTGAGLVAAVVLAGALPAWRASRVMPSDLIKSNAGTTTGRATKEFRWLMVGELALSMVLVLTAAMLGHATVNLANFSYGFEPRPLLRVDVSFPVKDDTLSAGARGELRRQLLSRIGSIGGVAADASFSQRRIDGSTVTSDVLAQRKGSLKQDRYFEVGPGFFQAAGIGIVEGRDVTEGDRATGGAAVLTRRLASSLFPAGKAIGGRVKFGPADSKSAWIDVVGIAADVRMDRPRDPSVPVAPEMFALTPNDASSSWSMVIRPDRGTDRVDVAASRTLRDALPSHARWTVAPWLANADDVDSMMVFIARIFGIFGVAALVLAGAGLYSVLSHSVAQRSREFGVRIALGATRRQVLQTVLIYGMQLMAAGVIIGLLMSFWSVSVLRAILFGLSPADPASIAISLTTMLSATLLACLAPAIRAMQSDPLEILRAA